MVATDMCGKNPYGCGYMELRETMTFLPFLFSFIIINFYNFSYIFTLHHGSAICVIILFVYDSDQHGTPATSGKELFVITIY